MNTDQINSLVRTIIKVVGTALITHGLTKAASVVNSEDVIGLVVTLTGVVLSQWKHAQTPLTGVAKQAQDDGSKTP